MTLASHLMERCGFPYFSKVHDLHQCPLWPYKMLEVLALCSRKELPLTLDINYLISLHRKFIQKRVPHIREIGVRASCESTQEAVPLILGSSSILYINIYPSFLCNWQQNVTIKFVFRRARNLHLGYRSIDC